MISTLILLLAACGKGVPAVEPPVAAIPNGTEAIAVNPAPTELGVDLIPEEANCVEECLRENMASPLPVERIRQNCESACSGALDQLGEGL